MSFSVHECCLQSSGENTIVRKYIFINVNAGFVAPGLAVQSVMGSRPGHFQILFIIKIYLVQYNFTFLIRLLVLHTTQDNSLWRRTKLEQRSST